MAFEVFNLPFVMDYTPNSRDKGYILVFFLFKTIGIWNSFMTVGIKCHVDCNLELFYGLEETFN